MGYFHAHLGACEHLVLGSEKLEISVKDLLDHQNNVGKLFMNSRSTCRPRLEANASIDSAFPWKNEEEKIIRYYLQRVLEHQPEFDFELIQVKDKNNDGFGKTEGQIQTRQGVLKGFSPDHERLKAERIPEDT